MKKTHVFISLFCIVIFSIQLNAQNFSFGTSAGFGLNVFNGDIKSKATTGGGMGFFYSVKNQLDLGFSFNIGTFQGQDENLTYNNIKGLKFYTTYSDYNIKAKYNLYHHHDENPLSKMGVYVSLGLGIIEFTDKLEDLDGNFIAGYGYYKKDVLKYKSTSEFYMPIGFGFKYRLSQHFCIGIEPNFVWVNTDKLDFLTTNNNRDSYFYFPLIIEFKPFREISE